MDTMQASIKAEIRSANDMFEQNIGKGDAVGMANLYTEDGMLLPTGSEIIKGRSAIQDFWKGAMGMGIKRAKLESMEVEQCEKTAIETGHYTLAGADNHVIDKGKYIVIWKNEGGSWKLQKDIWNSSLPVH